MLQAMTHLASASAGAIVSAFIRVPTDTLKHRVQAYLLPDIWRVIYRLPPWKPGSCGNYSITCADSALFGKDHAGLLINCGPNVSYIKSACSHNDGSCCCYAATWAVTTIPDNHAVTIYRSIGRPLQDQSICMRHGRKLSWNSWADCENPSLISPAGGAQHCGGRGRGGTVPRAAADAAARRAGYRDPVCAVRATAQGARAPKECHQAAHLGAPHPWRLLRCVPSLLYMTGLWQWWRREWSRRGPGLPR